LFPVSVANVRGRIFSEKGDTYMLKSTSVRRWIAALAGVAAIGSARLALAQDNSTPLSLVYAVYDGENTAKEAYAAMKDSQKQGVIHIDSFAVISKDQKGHVHVKSTQKKGARTGAVVGALVGVLGGPAGMAAGAAAGGGIGYLTGNAVGIPRETINEIKSSLTPGSSAIVAVVEERWVSDLESSMRAAQAKQVLDSKLANPSGGQAPNTGTSQPPAQGDAPANP
jgi:uncharacterized membrane protein